MDRGSPIANIVEGFRFVFQNRPIHALLILLGIASVTGTPFTVLMPVFADRILQGGPKALGWLTGCAGIGALIAALLLASRQTLKGLSVWVAVASTAFGVGLVAFALSRSFLFSAAVLVPVGFSLMLQMGSSNTLIQSMVPDQLRGRVMGVYSMVIMGMAPIGGLLAGLVADRLGAPVTVAIGGVICLISAAIFWTQLAEIRVHMRRMIAEQRATVTETRRLVRAVTPLCARASNQVKVVAAMKTRYSLFTATLGLAFVAASPGISASLPDLTGAPQMVVTVLPGSGGSRPENLLAGDLNVSLDKSPAPIARLQRLTGDLADMQLFLLLDDSTRSSSLSIHLKELKNFLNTLPPTTQVAIGYMRNGSFSSTQDFTARPREGVGGACACRWRCRA